MPTPLSTLKPPWRYRDIKDAVESWRGTPGNKVPVEIHVVAAVLKWYEDALRDQEMLDEAALNAKLEVLHEIGNADRNEQAARDAVSWLREAGAFLTAMAEDKQHELEATQ